MLALLIAEGLLRFCLGVDTIDVLLGCLFFFCGFFLKYHIIALLAGVLESCCKLCSKSHLASIRILFGEADWYCT